MHRLIDSVGDARNIAGWQDNTPASSNLVYGHSASALKSGGSERRDAAE